MDSAFYASFFEASIAAASAFASSTEFFATNGESSSSHAAILAIPTLSPPLFVYLLPFSLSSPPFALNSASRILSCSVYQSSFSDSVNSRTPISSPSFNYIGCYFRSISLNLTSLVYFPFLFFISCLDSGSMCYHLNCPGQCFAT